MIPKRVIDDFFARTLKDSNRVKAFSEEALDAKLADLNPPPVFHTPPRYHQKAAFLLGEKYPRYLMLLDPGLGKSWIALQLAKYRIDLGVMNRCLVLIPNSSNIYSWKNQVRTHTPDLTYTGIDGLGKEQREEQWNSGAQITISTYMGLVARVCGEKDVDEEGKIPKGWKIDEKKIKEVSSMFRMLVMDEITAAANHSSLTHKVCRKMQESCLYRYGLTGTPFGSNVEPLWGEFFLVDKGETLGETLGLFRACFFTEKKNYFTGWPEYTFDRKTEDDLNRVIRHRSIRYREEECLDLPPVVWKRLSIAPSVEQIKYHDAILARVKQTKGDPTALKNIFNRMRLLSRGYIITKDEETEEKGVSEMKDNPAMDALLAAIEEVPIDRKIVIFHYYNLTGHSIVENLKKHKYKHVHLWSKTKDKSAVQRTFEEDPKCRIMVSSPSGAFGNNWQHASYVFYYETPTDPKIRTQMYKRCHRDGQLHRVFVTDLVVRKMIDSKILKAIEMGLDLFDAVVNGKEELS